MEGKKKREMTPEMLEKLALARAKAQEVRKQIKAEKDAKALEELPEKLERQAKIKEELSKPPKPKPEVRRKKPIPEDNPVMDSPTSDSDDYSYEEPATPAPKKEKKKKKKQILVMEDSSSDEEQYIYVPKRRGRPQNPLAKDLPARDITPAVSVEDYSKPLPVRRPIAPPAPPAPPAPAEPSYGDLARQGLTNHRFGGFPRF